MWRYLQLNFHLSPLRTDNKHSEYDMKKILSIIFASLFVLSIMASVSEDLQAKVRLMTGGHSYSASMVPVPNLPVQKDNLAVKDDVKETVKNLAK